MQIEQRFVQARANLRSTKAPGKTFIEGHAARFSVVSSDLGGFREIIAKQAFDRTLASGAEVVALINHDVSRLLARTRNKTLALRTDASGLYFKCDVNSRTTAGRDALAYLRRGDLSEMSFAFSCVKDSWSRGLNPDGTGYDLRTLEDVDLHDISTVVQAAYPSTDARISGDDGDDDDDDDDDYLVERMHKLFPSGLEKLPVELRSRLRSIAIRDTDETRLRRLTRAHLDILGL